jgi:hypothetical protein
MWMSIVLCESEPIVSNEWNTTTSTTSIIRPSSYNNIVSAAVTTIKEPVSLPPVVVPMSRKRPYFTEITSTTSSKLAARVTVVRTNYPWKVVVPDRLLSTTHPSLLLLLWNNNTVTRHVTSSRLYRRHHLPLETTLRQAQRHHCSIVAANGGPFDAQGWTTGPTIVNGQLVRTTPNSLLDSTLVGFGTTAKTKQWILGNYRQFITSYNNNNNNDNSSLVDDIDNFCTGFGWLVYDGQVVANNTINPTGAKRAPRTAIGLDYDGNVLLVVVDGCEKWYVIKSHNAAGVF